MNTTKKGKVTFLIFKEKRARLYTGVCLEFGLVYQHKDENTVRCELQTAALGYLKTVAKEKMNDKLLNDQAEKKYFKLYDNFLKEETKRIGSRKSLSDTRGNDFSGMNVNVVRVNQLTDCYA